MKKFGVEEAKVATTPQTVGVRLEADTSKSSDEIGQQKYQYRELVGCLQYLVRGTRPDIANAVRELSRFLSC